MKLSTLILIGTVAGWSASQYPDYEFKCIDDDGETLCKWIKCKYFPKLKVVNKYVPGVPTDVIKCPSLAESGCPTEWGFRYQVGKSKVKLYEKNTHDLVPANGMKHSSKTGKLTITCLNSGANSKAFCRPKFNKNATPANIEFKWQAGTPPDCAGPGESWAPWGEWSGTNTSECKRGTASRSRQCLDGPHPGAPTACSTQPAGSANESKTYWPKVCKKCHADLGMMHTPGQLNVPNLKLPSTLKDHEEDKFDDGFVPVGAGVVKLRCHDEDDYVKPYKQTCKCDNNGCRLNDAPLCQGANYKGYGTEYFWQPGAKDTFKNDDTNEHTTVHVNDDFSITYNNESHDPDQRFKNRVSWWEDGPSICRYWNKYSYVAGIERPIHLNDDGSLDFDFYNWLECDTYLNNFANSGTTSNGAKYYEVLTADNTVSWKPAAQFTDQEIEDQMVIVGNSEQFARKFFGLCRMSSCTVMTQLGGECYKKTANLNSQHMVEHMEHGYPGVLVWSGNANNGNWKCQNLLVTANLAESENPNSFKILMKN